MVLLALKGADDAGYLLLHETGELRRSGVAQVAYWAEAVRAAYEEELVILNIRNGRLSRPVGAPNLRAGKMTPQLVPVEGFMHGPTFRGVAWAYGPVLLPDNPTWE